MAPTIRSLRALASSFPMFLLPVCAACAQNTSPGFPEDPPAPAGADAAAPASGRAGGDAGAPSTPTTPTTPSTPTTPGQPGTPDAEPPVDAPPVPLPFYVSDEFIPSGFMGDNQGTLDGIKLSSAPTDCKSPRPTGAGGDCYAVTWTPKLNGTSSWAGVYWQSSSNNWGAKAGKKIAAGASKVSFMAVGAAGGEKIQFKVGGVNVRGDNPSLTHRDTFSEGIEVTLTTSWTRYEVPLASVTYDAVIGGFAWVTSSTTTAPIRFYLDDVRWER